MTAMEPLPLKAVEKVEKVEKTEEAKAGPPKVSGGRAEDMVRFVVDPRQHGRDTFPNTQNAIQARCAAYGSAGKYGQFVAAKRCSFLCPSAGREFFRASAAL